MTAHSEAMHNALSGSGQRGKTEGLSGGVAEAGEALAGFRVFLRERARELPRPLPRTPFVDHE